MRRLLRRIGWLALALAGGCAAPTANLPPDVLQRLQREARAEIYDRQNDIVIAQGRRDDVLLQLESLRRDGDEIDARAKRVATRLAKQPEGPVHVAAMKGTLAAHHAYLDAERKQAEAALDAADVDLALASARLEQTRQRQLVRTGRALAKAMAPFDARVDALEKRSSDLQRRVQDLRAETEKSYEAWKTAEEQHARAAGDWDAGIWID